MLRDRQIVLPSFARAAGGVILRSLNVRFTADHHHQDAPPVSNFLPFGQLDHMHARRISAFLARPAFQRGFQFPDRRIARAPDSIERNAGLGARRRCYSCSAFGLVSLRA